MAAETAHTPIAVVRSGGQTGVDRAALDAARAAGLRIAGWCPRGGWAEDRTQPPGLLADYPELAETPTQDPAERTVWNVRDSDATLLVLLAGGTESSGTRLTLETAEALRRPVRVLQQGDPREVSDWLHGLGPGISLNVAGPRESEAPGSYALTRRLLREILGQRRH